MEHNQEYYDKEFGFYNSKISRGELESLPCPFCTDHVSDDVMQSIIMMTDLSTKQRLKLPDDKKLNFKKDKVSEVWWGGTRSCCEILQNSLLRRSTRR